MRKDKKRKNGKEMTEWNHWRNSGGLKIEINQRKDSEESTNSQDQNKITEENYEDSDTRGKKSLKTSIIKRNQEKRALRSQTVRVIHRKQLKETRRRSITRKIKIKILKEDMKCENRKEIAEQRHEELETIVRYWRKSEGLNIEINWKEGTEENLKNWNRKRNNGMKLGKFR